MRRFMGQLGIAVPSLILLLGTISVLAQGAPMPSGYNRSQKLPSAFLALIPEGYTVESQERVQVGQMASLSFAAKKEFEGRHSLYYSEYGLDLKIKESAGQLIKMQAPAYRKQLELDIEQKLSSYRASESDATTGYDPPQEVKYPWGAGITQRVVHKYMGAGTNPDEIGYRCEYFGLIVGDRSLKKFALSVSGVGSAAEADAWAKKAAAKIAQTGLGDLGDK